MKAQEHPRIRLEGRTNLAEAIPLDTPLHVFIDPSQQHVILNASSVSMRIRAERIMRSCRSRYS